MNLVFNYMVQHQEEGGEEEEWSSYSKQKQDYLKQCLGIENKERDDDDHNDE